MMFGPAYRHPMAEHSFQAFGGSLYVIKLADGTQIRTLPIINNIMSTHQLLSQIIQKIWRCYQVLFQYQKFLPFFSTSKRKCFNNSSSLYIFGIYSINILFQTKTSTWRRLYLTTTLITGFIYILSLHFGPLPKMTNKTGCYIWQELNDEGMKSLC